LVTKSKEAHAFFKPSQHDMQQQQLRVAIAKI